MILCPNCSQKLPDGAGYCQFCQANFPPTAGPAMDPDDQYVVTTQPRWIVPAYNAIAWWWIVDGALDIVTDIAEAGKNGLSPVGLIFGALTIIIGIGILCKVELARGILNICCFLKILGGVMGLFFAFFSPFVMGIHAVVIIMLDFLNIGLAILMIYLIGETETRGPNF